jgi:hypothetical protein
MNRGPDRIPSPAGFSPYAPPAFHAQPGALPGAQVVLYSPTHVAIAAFFGTALGGAVVLAINERRLGRPQAATLAVILGVLASAALLGIGFLLPDNFPSAPLGLLPLIALRTIAQQRQGELVKAHAQAGGKMGSGWTAFGLGLACLAAVLVPCVVLAVIAGLAG